MNRDLQTTSTDVRPALQSPAQANLLARLTNGLEPSDGRDRSSISSHLAPTDTERGALQSRRFELRRGLAPVQGRQAALSLAERILRMFHAWPTVRLDEDKALGVAETYAAQLEHLPTWAIVAGILEVQGRKTPFPPSVGELRATCEAKVQPAKDELIAIGRVLDAEVYTRTEHGEAAIERVREVAASFAARNAEAMTAPKRETMHPWLEQRRKDREATTIQVDSPLPVLSDAARAAAGYALREASR